MHAGRWLAIVIAILVLLGGGYATWKLNRDRNAHFAREAELRQTLFTMRKSLDAFHKSNGRYPRSLQELYPQGVPVDPVTHSATTWRVITESAVQPNTDFTSTATKTETYVIDVRSGAPGPYSEW